MIVVRRYLLAAVATASVLAGCGESEMPPPTSESTVEPTSPESSPAPDLPAVQQAIADLAESLEVDEADVEVVAVEEVTWRNGSRGCATRGTMYTQALIDGSRITLRVDGTDYEYHSGGSQPPRLCTRPTE